MTKKQDKNGADAVDDRLVHASYPLLPAPLGHMLPQNLVRF